MAFIDWSNDFDVCVNDMNDQHKILMKIMNELFELNTSGKPKTLLMQKLGELGSFTVKHFTEEEQFMESIHFDGLVTHKLIHKDLLEKFTRHMTAFDQGSTQTLGTDFFGFLKVWLLAHIQGIDTKYGAVVKKSAA